MKNEAQSTGALLIGLKGNKVWYTSNEIHHLRGSLFLDCKGNVFNNYETSQLRLGQFSPLILKTGRINNYKNVNK